MKYCIAHTSDHLCYRCKIPIIKYAIFVQRGFYWYHLTCFKEKFGFLPPRKPDQFASMGEKINKLKEGLT